MLITIFTEIPCTDNYIGPRKILQKPVFATGVRKGKEVYEINEFSRIESFFLFKRNLNSVNLIFNLIITDFQ